MQLYVVRHAHAGSRGAWTADDRERPLSAKGRAQADELAEHFEHHDIARVVSSPAARCVQTVEPLATRLGLAVEVDDTLFEGSWVTDVVELAESLDESTVLCTHGDVVPDLLRGLANRGTTIIDPMRWSKGSTWVIEREGDTFTKARYVPAPDGVHSAG